MAETNPIRTTDDEARALAHQLLAAARFAALGVLDRETGAPMVSRIALARAPDGAPLTLISRLSAHTGHLLADPRASLLVGEPGPTGDPLTHPRMTLAVRARMIAMDDPERAALRETYLAQTPKAKLYIDFADFLFARFEVTAAALNGGFGKAYHLTPADLGLPPP